MHDSESIVRVNESLPDLTQVLSQRLLRLTILTLFLGALLTVTSLAYAQDLVHWPDCPPEPQVFHYDPASPSDAHFQWGSPAVNCSLDVVSGSVFSVPASSAGGFGFYTPGEVAGDTYTTAFDMQWVTGGSWAFANETAEDGDTNGLGFGVPYPGNSCWHHYEYTAPTGPPVCKQVNEDISPLQACGQQLCGAHAVCVGGPKNVMFVYQGASGPQQEMRIANLTMRRVGSATPNGLVVSEAGGGCSEQPEEWTTNAYNSFHVRLPVGKDSDACLTESEGAVINNCKYEVSVVFDSPVIFRKDPIVHYITAQNYVHGTGAVGATCNIWSYDGNGGGKEGTNSRFNPNGAQALTFTSLKFGNTISLLCDLPVGEGISALHWNP